MAADEHQSQHVIAIVGFIQPLSEIRLWILDFGNDVIVWKRLLTAAASRFVQRKVASNQNQPGRWIARRAVRCPMLECSQTGFLKCFLSDIEVTEVTQQRAERLRSRRSQCGCNPSAICHCVSP